MGTIACGRQFVFASSQAFSDVLVFLYGPCEARYEAIYLEPGYKCSPIRVWTLPYSPTYS